MICIKGEVIRSADELCDSCAVKLCPTEECLSEQYAAEKHNGYEQILRLNIKECQMYQEILP